MTRTPTVDQLYKKLAAITAAVDKKIQAANTAALGKIGPR